MIELAQNGIIQEDDFNQPELQDLENEEYTSIQTIFQGLKEIRQFQLNNNYESEIIKEQCLFYFNFTKDQSFYNESQQAINPKIIKSWNDGFLKNDNDQQIIAYFQNILQTNGNSEVVNYLQLSKIKLFVKLFLQKNKFQRLNFVVQFNQEQNEENINLKMKHRIYQLFEGFFEEPQEDIMIFCVLSKAENINGDLEVNQCDNFGQIYCFNEEQFRNELIHIDISQITINYFNQITNHKINVMQQVNYFKSIGYICSQYIQTKVYSLFDQLMKTLSLLKFQLKTLLEFPTNLNEQVILDSKIEKYQDDLKELIEKINEKITNQIQGLQLYQLVNNILTTVRESSETIKQDIKNMSEVPNISWIIKEYLTKQENNILNFHNNFQPQYNDILEYFKEYYTYDYVKETIQTFQNYLLFWLNHYDSYIPQRLSQFSRLFNNPNISQSTYDSENVVVVVLGLSKVGKSTLLNIVNNPNNMILEEPYPDSYRFNVIGADKGIEISHGNNSQTSQIFDLKIETNNSHLIFIDNTLEERSLDNQINIFQRLIKSKQFVILFMIDGEGLIQSKRGLQEQIKLTNSFFNEQLNSQYLEQILIPVFTKVSEATMENIQREWETETMKDCNKLVNEFLRIIKKKIDSNQYILIHNARSYFTSNLDELKEEYAKKLNEIQVLRYSSTEQDKNLLNQKRNEKEDIELQIKHLEANKQKIQYNISGSSISDLREKILNQCQLLIINQQREEQVQLKLQLSLTMKHSLETVLNQFNKLNSLIDQQISNEIVKNIFYKSRSFNEIQSLLPCIQEIISQFNETHINSEELWIGLCEKLNMPKNTCFLDEYLFQIQRFHYLYSTQVQQQTEEITLKLEKLDRNINLVQTICKQINDIIIKKNQNKSRLKFPYFIQISRRREIARLSDISQMQSQDEILQLIRLEYHNRNRDINI